MKKVTSILLLIVLLLHFFTRIGVLGYYLINHDYIVTMLCINRDNPEKHCDGNCYLAAKMSETEEQEKAPSIPVGFRYEQVEFITENNLHPDLSPSVRKADRLFSTYCFFYSFLGVRGIFRPPPTLVSSSLRYHSSTLFKNT